MVGNCIGKMLEKIDEYLINLDKSNFNITNDAINLFKFMIEDDIKKGKILEIGPGSGYISIKLYKYNKNITSIEVQKSVYDILKQNLNDNNIDITLLNMDIKEHKGKYNFIVSNPPYYKLSSGKYPENICKKYSKFEFLLDLDSLCKKIYELLLDENSRFYIVYPLYRKDEVVKSIKNNNLYICKEKIQDNLYFVSGLKNF